MAEIIENDEIYLEAQERTASWNSKGICDEYGNLLKPALDAARADYDRLRYGLRGARNLLGVQNYLSKCASW